MRHSGPPDVNPTDERWRAPAPVSARLDGGYSNQKWSGGLAVVTFRILPAGPAAQKMANEPLGFRHALVRILRMRSLRQTCSLAGYESRTCETGKCRAWLMRAAYGLAALRQ